MESPLNISPDTTLKVCVCGFVSDSGMFRTGDKRNEFLEDGSMNLYFLSDLVARKLSDTGYSHVESRWGNIPLEPLCANG